MKEFYPYRGGAVALHPAIQKVIFLDRDGTINRDSPDYIKNWEEFAFLPGSLDALALLTRHGFCLFIVTNQSVINRGMVPMTVLEKTHHLLQERVAADGGRICDLFFCPHRPDERCACRKPKPGLILQACARYGLDPATSYMIGDSARDILCGRNAGCGTNILVLTGNGAIAQKELAEQNAPADLVFPDLYQAAQWIVGQGQTDRRQ
jgi:D-glycero-D-manno-heptose 1,7-bisphosphate phosphatase